MKIYKILPSIIIGVLFGLNTSIAGKTLSVTESEYGNKWSYSVSEIKLECINNAVIGHTSIGTFNINGKAMSRFKGTYRDGYEISKQHPDIDDPQAKMPPPSGLINRGLALCE